MSLLRLIQHHYPGAEWNCPADLVRANWDRVQWFGPGDKPTLADLDALPEPPEPLPQTITRRQLYIALHRAGRLADARAWMQDAGTDPEHVITAQEAAAFHRSSPALAALAAYLGYGAAALDTLFRQAGGIEE